MVASCSLDAIRAYLRGAAAAEAVQIQRIACLHRLTIEVGRNYISVDNSAARRNVRTLNEELAQALIQIGQLETDATARAGFLVRGFRLETDFQGTWRSNFPEAEVDGTTLYSAQSITITIPCAFQLLVRSGDYFGASALTGLPVTDVHDLSARDDYWYACLPADGTPPQALREQLLKVHGVSIYITTRLPRPLPGSLTELETALAIR